MVAPLAAAGSADDGASAWACGAEAAALRRIVLAASVAPRPGTAFVLRATVEATLEVALLVLGLSVLPAAAAFDPTVGLAGVEALLAAVLAAAEAVEVLDFADAVVLPGAALGAAVDFDGDLLRDGAFSDDTGALLEAAVFEPDALDPDEAASAFEAAMAFEAAAGSAAGADFFVAGADFFVAGADFFVAGADFFVAGTDFFVAGADLFVAGVDFFAACSDLFMAGADFVTGGVDLFGAAGAAFRTPIAPPPAAFAVTRTASAFAAATPVIRAPVFSVFVAVCAGMALFGAFRTAPVRSAMAIPHMQNGRAAGRRALRGWQEYGSYGLPTNMPHLNAQFGWPTQI